MPGLSCTLGKHFTTEPKLGFNIGYQMSLEVPLGFFIISSTCSFLLPYSACFVNARGPGVRRPCGPPLVHIPFHADRFLP